MNNELREAFEVWFQRQPENGGKRPNRAHGDGYFTYSTDRMWQAWQAAAAIYAPRESVMREALRQVQYDKSFCCLKERTQQAARSALQSATTGDTNA